MNDGSNDFMNKVLVSVIIDSLYLCSNTSRNGVIIMIVEHQLTN